MPINQNKQNLLKKLPGVDRMLALMVENKDMESVPRSVITESIRQTIDHLRTAVLKNQPGISQDDFEEPAMTQRIMEEIKRRMSPRLRRTINATGVVIHTNLGRSLLADDAIANVQLISGRYSNLEFNLETGKRGLRYSAVEELLCGLCGSEAAMVVNNNAAAVLLCLDTMARGREVIVSRGELVEIGGSFRIPEVMEKSGCTLKEVGTTNRTHSRDYDNAVNSETGLLLKVHTSNYSIVGFTASVSLTDMVALGKKHGIPVMEDLGSGTLVDFSKYGLAKEPTVQESVAAGCDIVSFSGDKLLGGPQAGIIVGKKDWIERIRKNPLTRALRIDKMTLSALESTLRIYRDEQTAVRDIPTLRMITMTKEQTAELARILSEKIGEIGDSRIETCFLDLFSKAGGGSLPLLELPSTCLGLKIQGLSANALEQKLRGGTPHVIVRIENDTVILDPRTIQSDEPELIRECVRGVLSEMNNEK
ncbi:MAG: L-seryl-tRNA(Sec) selenium transferase [Desulfobacteraceae bacterium]|jgi:L-seryl-tRNA(Ser) seleniumtransferase